jgi:two-component system, NarL family, response regulator DesR
MFDCLIVEDQESIRKKIAETISLIAGYRVVAESGSGKEAISLINGLKPDIIILDLRLNDISGIEVLSAMKKNNINIPVIVFTQIENKRYEEKCLSLGASFYLLKKDGLEKLKGTLNRIIKN